MSERAKSVVFTPGRIGHLQIKNRLVRSATYENGATSKGEVSGFLVEIYPHPCKRGCGNDHHRHYRRIFRGDCTSFDHESG